MTRASSLAFSAVLISSLACFGGNGDTADTDPSEWCEDLEGPSGEVIHVLGNWSASFATQHFRESCGELEKASFNFLKGAVEIDGYTPDGIKIIFQGDRDNRLQGIIAPSNGISFSGQRPSAWGEMHIAIGGLVYPDVALDRTVIQGYAYIGVDIDNDGTIDCDARGDWKAIKSGL